MKDLILFIDSGDTLVDESTEIRDDTGVVVQAELIPGAAEAVRTLWRQGYRIALVADGLRASFDRPIYRQHGLEGCFEARGLYRSESGVQPHARDVLISAMEQMGLTDADKDRIVMVGNNLERDIAGANRLGAHLHSDELDDAVPPAASCAGGDAGFCGGPSDELPALLAELDRQMKNAGIRRPVPPLPGR